MAADAETTLTSLLEQLQNQIDSKNAKLFISSGKFKMRILNEFVLMFASIFLQTIDDYKLTRNDIRVVLKIIEYAQYGNLLKMSYSTLAKDLSIDKGDISKSIKRIKNSQLIIDIDGNLYLNPHIICKGRFNVSDENDEKIINKSADLLDGSNRKPSIETKHIKNKIQKDQLSFENILS